MDKFLNVEGIIIENKALSNHELIEYIKQLKIKHFRGVFMRDDLPKKKRTKESTQRSTGQRPECGIVNLADSLSDGTHWVCYYNGYYFDSYGLPPPLEIVEYLGENSALSEQLPKVDLEYNIYQIQKSGQICGHLCLYFLNRITKGMEFNEIIFSLLK